LYTAILGAVLVAGGLSANAVTLADLQYGTAGILDGGTPAGTVLTLGDIKVGNLVFSDFVTTVGGGGLPPYGHDINGVANNIDVAATFSGGLAGFVLDSSDWLRTQNGPVIDTPDVTLSYMVSVNPLAAGTQITDAHLSASMVGVLLGGGLVPNDIADNFVSEALSNGYSMLIFNGQQMTGSGLQPYGNTLTASAYFTTPVTSLDVFKDMGQTIFLANGGTTGIVHMSGLSQTFSTTPEPGTLAMLFGFGVASTMFGLRRRIRR